ncbi:MAG: hypothetical protein EA412_04985 [Chitinophagaceae bacterium]|nr:MAG: hypothetical protein EA412_04985 [Chitinophagaceae bacterium]
MNVLKISFFLAILSIVSINLQAQDGVAINNDGTPPHPSAIVDVSSDSKGFLPPRLTSAERDAITPPVEGLIIFNEDSECINFYNGNTWREVCQN